MILANFIAYPFLDPKAQGGMLAAYIFGVMGGQIIIFSVGWGICRLRMYLLEKYGKISKADLIDPESQEEEKRSDHQK